VIINNRNARTEILHQSIYVMLMDNCVKPVAHRLSQKLIARSAADVKQASEAVNIAGLWRHCFSIGRRSARSFYRRPGAPVDVSLSETRTSCCNDLRVASLTERRLQYLGDEISRNPQRIPKRDGGLRNRYRLARKRPFSITWSLS
jgi:hypothetical protein